MVWPAETDTQVFITNRVFHGFLIQLQYAGGLTEFCQSLVTVIHLHFETLREVVLVCPVSYWVYVRLQRSVIVWARNKWSYTKADHQHRETQNNLQKENHLASHGCRSKRGADPTLILAWGTPGWFLSIQE